MTKRKMKGEVGIILCLIFVFMISICFGCDCYSYWVCPNGPATPVYPDQCSQPPFEYIGPGAIVLGNGGEQNGYLVHTTAQNQIYRFIPSSAECVQKLLFGDCSYESVPVRNDFIELFTCDGTATECGLITPSPSPTNVLNYNADKGETDNIDCGDCESLPTCAVTESDVQNCQIPSSPGAGCSDNTREGFTDQTIYPNIAGCSGGWSIPGLRDVNYIKCNRDAGNNGLYPNGNGCTAQDLCAENWHICQSPTEVQNALPSGTVCEASQFPAGTDELFATQVTGSGNNLCDEVGFNDVFGCGNTPTNTPQSDCSPLNIASDDLCGKLPSPPWNCGTDHINENVNVFKTGPTNGGVLCCFG